MGCEVYITGCGMIGDPPGIDYDTPIGCVECVVSCACVLCMWCACMCEYVWYGKPELVRVL